MKLVIFGLSVTSSWGNGHATLWRGLIKALGARGHKVVFFERNVPYYAKHRDLETAHGGEVVLYENWPSVVSRARQELNDADVGMVTSYCPDGPEACSVVLESRAPVKSFYDLDAPVTLHRVREGESVAYLPASGLGGFDVVLSYTGGAALTDLRTLLGARHVAALYGSVDPEVHHPVPASPRYACDVSYLGTYADERQVALETLFIEPARRLPHRKFLIGGSQYPPQFPWSSNIYFVQHVPPADHAAFYCSSRITVNVTRAAMADAGYCPSGRLFEAAACEVPMLSDDWAGLDRFFEPGLEIIVARTTGHAMDAFGMSDGQLRRIAKAARERVLVTHTASVRALELENILEAARKAPGERASGMET
jgi:spore maturation protein CgeB